MTEKTKKTLSRLYATGLILLAALLTVMTVLPVLSFDVSDQSYASGRFTQHAMALDKAEAGIGTIITIAKEFDDFTTVNGIEGNDERLAQIEKDIRKAENNREKIAKLEQERSEVRADQSERLSKLTEQDYERIKTKMENDADFVTAFAVIGAIDKMFIAMDQSVQLSDPLLDMSLVLAMVMLFATALMVFVYPIVVAITFLVKLIQFFVNLKKADIDKTEKRMNMFPFEAYPSIMIILVTMFSITNTSVAVSVGSGVLMATIVWLAAGVLRAVKAIVCAKNNRARVIVKQVLSVLAAVLVFVLLINFSGLFMLQGIREDHVVLNGIYHTALTEQQQGSVSDIKDTVETVVLLNRILIYFFVIVAIEMIIITLMVLIDRFRYKTTKTKNGIADHNASILGLAIILLVIAIVPVVFNAPTHDAKIESYQKGIYKTCYNAYLEDGTSAKAAYDKLKEEYDFGVEFIDGLQEELKTAQGEQAEEITFMLERAELELVAIEQDIKEIETKQSKAVLGIVMAALFVVIEIFYILVDKIIGAKEEKVEQAPAEQTPAEQAPAEE